MTELAEIKSYDFAAKEQATGCSDTDSSHQLGPLLLANVATLSEGANVLRGMDNTVYTASCSPIFMATIGAHFRHLIEHYSCFLRGVAEDRLQVCYTQRERNPRIELERDYALQTLHQVMEQLGGSELDRVSRRVWRASDQDVLDPVPTTLARELLFLQSHSIHHFAIIAAMCRMHDFAVPENFGIAISTQAFNAAQALCGEEVDISGKDNT